jgi:hypothetical protein
MARPDLPTHRLAECSIHGISASRGALKASASAVMLALLAACGGGDGGTAGSGTTAVVATTPVAAPPVVDAGPPQLTVLEPTAGSVALPTLPVNVTCTDDQPGCVVTVFGPSNGSSRPVLASGRNGFAGSIDLTQSFGVAAASDLRIVAEDAAKKSVVVTVPVFVEKPARLMVLTRVPGTILDVDATRIVAIDPTRVDDRLFLHSRATGAVELITMSPVGSLQRFFTPRLLPNGVVYLPSAGTKMVVPGISTLVGLSDLKSLQVNGAFAVWRDGTSLTHFDSRSATMRGVSPAADDEAIGADGTFVFRSASAGNLIRDRAGVQVPLTPVTASVERAAPVTDGANVVFRETIPAAAGGRPTSAIGFIADTKPPVLLAPHNSGDANLATGSYLWPPRPGASYQVASGWIAYTDFTGASLQQVFTRNPSGQIAQRTQLPATSTIDRLAPNGELMTVSGGPLGGTRHFSRPGTQPIEIGTSNGTSYYIDGKWYIALGGTLLSVDTQSP